jgi:hypothetical protein
MTRVGNLPSPDHHLSFPLPTCGQQIPVELFCRLKRFFMSPSKTEDLAAVHRPSLRSEPGSRHAYATRLPSMAPYTYDHSKENINSLIAEVREHDINYTTDTTIRDSKSHTPHSPALPHETPLAVFFPTSTHHTSLILKACNERSVAVTSFSGGTSFGGALTAIRGGVCVSFERMDRLVRMNEEDMDVVVQPGLGWVELNERVKDKGVFFPVDPAPGARVGGMVRSLPVPRCRRC